MRAPLILIGIKSACTLLIPIKIILLRIYNRGVVGNRIFAFLCSYTFRCCIVSGIIVFEQFSYKETENTFAFVAVSLRNNYSQLYVPIDRGIESSPLTRVSQLVSSTLFKVVANSHTKYNYIKSCSSIGTTIYTTCRKCSYNIKLHL